MSAGGDNRNSGGLMIDWDNLLKREGAAVWRTVYRLVRHQADAEECFQETFLAALAVADRERVENRPGLLQRLATARGVHRLRKRVRRRGQEEIADLALSASAEAGPAQQAETAELARPCSGRWRSFRRYAMRKCFACTN